LSIPSMMMLQVTRLRLGALELVECIGVVVKVVLLLFSGSAIVPGSSRITTEVFVWRPSGTKVGPACQTVQLPPEPCGQAYTVGLVLTFVSPSITVQCSEVQ
jgi:hypothetical protein